MEPAPFSRWSGDAGDTEFALVSDDALVASAQTVCVKCRERIEVICLYCESGTDLETDELLMQFTVSNIWAMDSALATQLARWRFFRRESGAGSEEGCFANHCPHCGAMQEDTLLHAEPGGCVLLHPGGGAGSDRTHAAERAGSGGRGLGVWDLSRAAVVDANFKPVRGGVGEDEAVLGV
jgi:hypothetical protein